MRLFADPRRALILCLVLSSVLAFGLIGCSDDDDDDNPVNPGPPSTELSGTYASAAEGGTMSITIAAEALAPALRAGALATHTIAASAALYPEGTTTTIPLTGSYSEESDTLNLTGGGYTMVGEYDGTSSSITGAYTSPNGPGFFSCAVGGFNTIQVYCGAFESTMSPGSTGRWNVVISGTQLHGVGAEVGGGAFAFSGTATGTGTTRTIAVNHEIVEGVTLTADGQLDTNTGAMNGTYAIDDLGVPNDAGTWTGGTCSESWVGNTHLTGTFISASEGGYMTLTIQSGFLAQVKPAASMGQHAIQATGTLHLDAGGMIQVAGYYNPETDTLAVAGSGYTLVGAYDESGVDAIVGQYIGPTDAGFFGCAVGSSSAVRVYCGEFQNEGLTVGGRWNLIVVGTNVVGIAISTDNDQFPFEGTVSGTGTTRTITLSANDGAGGTLTATGTLDTATFTISDGTWTTEINSVPVDSGTWGGALCPGQPVTPN